MAVFVILLSTAAFLSLADALLIPALQPVDKESDESRVARAWVVPPEMTMVSIYWENYSKRRNNAMDRCQTRLNLYTSRRKMFGSEVFRRNALAMQTDIRNAQEETKGSELALAECIEQLVALHGDDPFYREYQILSSEVQRLTDQVTSCAEAGGKITLVKRGAPLDATDPQMENQLENASMLRVFDNKRRTKAIKEAEKKECFASLAIPPSFPVQLEA